MRNYVQIDANHHADCTRCSWKFMNLSGSKVGVAEAQFIHFVDWRTNSFWENKYVTQPYVIRKLRHVQNQRNIK